MPNNTIICIPVSCYHNQVESTLKVFACLQPLYTIEQSAQGADTRLCSDALEKAIFQQTGNDRPIMVDHCFRQSPGGFGGRSQTQKGSAQVTHRRFLC